MTQCGPGSVQFTVHMQEIAYTTGGSLKICRGDKSPDDCGPEAPLILGPLGP